MTRMQWMGGVVLWGALGLAGLPTLAQSNLCYNASFSSTNGSLDGWNLDYDWTGSPKYAGNQKNASFLPEYKGRKNVLKDGGAQGS